jgi:hypothetical protein
MTYKYDLPVPLRVNRDLAAKIEMSWKILCFQYVLEKVKFFPFLVLTKQRYR